MADEPEAGMKRRAPVPRRKPLPRGNPPRRSTTKLAANQGKLGRQTRSATLDPGLRMDVLKRDNYRCARCGTYARPLHVHHRLPVSHGRDDSMENLVTLCGGGWGAGGCHPWVHEHPEVAYAEGWLIRSSSSG